jgi:hypothetical protein
MPARTANKDIRSLNRGEAQVEGILSGARDGDDAARRSTRIVAIPLAQILPDRFQSRTILPPELKAAFYAGRDDCYSAARALLLAADGDPALRLQVNELLALGESILKDGQIEPATGVWIQTPGGSRFLLETGERRFWSLALQAVQKGLEEEPRLKVTEETQTSRFRQIAENLQREDISAVDLGKAIAGLILSWLNQPPDPDMDELAYFRQALGIKKLPAGLWQDIIKEVRLSRPVLYRHLQLLRLEDDLLFLAASYRLEEGRLRQILAAPVEQQRRLTLMAIEEPRLTGDDLAGMAESEYDPDRDDQGSGGRSTARKGPRPPKGPHRQVAVRVRSALKLLQQPDFDGNLDEVANELAALYRDPRALEQAAASLERLAASVRKIRARRRAND